MYEDESEDVFKEQKGISTSRMEVIGGVKGSFEIGNLLKDISKALKVKRIPSREFPKFKKYFSISVD